MPAKSASRSAKVRTNGFGSTRVAIPYTDHNGYEVGEEYADKMLPRNGRLGWLLEKKGLKVNTLIIRFVGIYDTVPHHGVSQSNDITDLGLNAITKANYVVHLVAGDEHRKNFSLVDISCIIGKGGGGSNSKGIELYLPRVHCDVGGSYVEGRSETVGRIMVTEKENSKIAEVEKERLAKEGWFDKDQLTVHSDNWTRTVLIGPKTVLSSFRKKVSNQYSFIPLHIMVDFCKSEGLTISSLLDDKYKFRDSAYSNAAFLQTIEDKLKAYAKGGEKLEYKHRSVPQRAIVYATGDVNAVANEENRRLKEETEINKEFNKHIRRLRNEYLHWNAAYGEGKTGALDSLKQTLAQANEPNFEKGVRKREVRG